MEMLKDPFDHAAVEARGLLESYHLGSLDPEEEQRLEAHFMDCARCQEELEVQRSFLCGMRTVAAEEAARTAVGLGLLAWLRRRGVAAVLALLAVAVAGTAFVRLLRDNQRLETRLAELAAGPVKGALGGPLAAVPVVLLGVQRGDAEPAIVTDPGGPWSLAVDVAADGRFASYGVTVVDAAGEARFERRDLSPNVLEVIQLTFPGSFLPPGDYRLLVHGTAPGGDRVELGGYPFRLTAAR
jgi:hypothetical protein